MNTIKFGFIPIERRYEYLTNSSINCLSIPKMDLSEFLKNKYGTNYIEKDGSRLNHLAKLNGFTGFSKQTEVKTISDASDRLELLFSIIETEINGTLKVNENSINKINPIIDHIYESYTDYWIIKDKLIICSYIEGLLNNNIDETGKWKKNSKSLITILRKCYEENYFDIDFNNTDIYRDTLIAFKLKDNDKGFSYKTFARNWNLVFNSRIE